MKTNIVYKYIYTFIQDVQIQEVNLYIYTV